MKPFLSQNGIKTKKQLALIYMGNFFEYSQMPKINLCDIFTMIAEKYDFKEMDTQEKKRKKTKQRNG